jgi:hypothetical protein
MIRDAVTAFEARDYEQAQKYAEEVLRKDPRNEKAAELRDTSSSRRSASSSTSRPATSSSTPRSSATCTAR